MPRLLMDVAQLLHIEKPVVGHNFHSPTISSLFASIPEPGGSIGCAFRTQKIP